MAPRKEWGKNASLNARSLQRLLKAREFIVAGILRDSSVNREQPLERRGEPPTP